MAFQFENKWIFSYSNLPLFPKSNTAVMESVTGPSTGNPHSCWWASPSSFYPPPSQPPCSPRSGPRRSKKTCQRLRIPERGCYFVNISTYNDDGRFIYLLRIIQWTVVNGNRMNSNIKRLYMYLVNNWRSSNNYLMQSLALVVMNR